MLVLLRVPAFGFVLICSVVAVCTMHPRAYPAISKQPLNVAKPVFQLIAYSDELYDRSLPTKPIAVAVVNLSAKKMPLFKFFIKDYTLAVIDDLGRQETITELSCPGNATLERKEEVIWLLPGQLAGQVLDCASLSEMLKKRGSFIKDTSRCSFQITCQIWSPHPSAALRNYATPYQGTLKSRQYELKVDELKKLLHN